MEELYFKFGSELSFYRRNAGLKMYEVGVKLGWPRSRATNMIGKVEEAKAPVKLQTLLEVASLFGMTLELKWVPISSVKPTSYADIVSGKEAKEVKIELLGNQKNGSVATEPLTHKEKENEHRPPD